MSDNAVIEETETDAFAGENETEAAILSDLERTDAMFQPKAEPQPEPEPEPQPDAKPDGDAPAQEATTDGDKPEQEASTEQEKPFIPDNVRHMHGAYGLDKDGNAVNERGDIIAHAGRERGLLDRALRAERRNISQNEEMDKLRSRASMSDVLDGAPAKMGLSAEDVQTGLATVSAFKKNPAGAARWVLQEAMKMGHSLQDILGDAAQVAGLDMGAVQRMVQDAVAPIVDAHKRDAAAAEAEQAATRQYEDFLSKHEFADIHQDNIAMAMQRGDMDATDAYYMLKVWAAENGLDFSRPLGPQYEAKRAAAQTTEQPATRVAPSKPMPAGSGSHGSGVVPKHETPESAGDLYGANESFDDIIKNEMRKAGFQLN